MAGSRSSRGKREKRELPADEGAAPENASDSKESGFSGFVKKLRITLGTNKKLEDMTVREIFAKHPLFRAGKFIATPWLLYLGWFFIRLQHPEYVSTATGGLVRLRPAVHGTNVPRQVLIVATPGSGIMQMSSELRSKLRLEIGHERTDAAWQFTRDGTVSWIHGMRFLTRPDDAKGKVRAIAKICNSIVDTSTDMGYHPENFGPPKTGCSYRSRYSDCWRNDCYLTLMKERGCAVSGTCEVNFAKSLHQVRHPLRTIESLVAKHCVDGIDGIAEAPFLTYASSFFPHHDFYADSCLEATGTFVVMYQEAMIEARERGDIDAFYRIEDSSACDVAGLAGLLSDDTIAYEPNYARIERLCDKNGTNNSAQTIVEKKINNVNNDRVKLGWMDLRGGVHGSKRTKGDLTLEGSVKKLFAAFGYNEDNVSLQYKSEDAHIEL